MHPEIPTINIENNDGKMWDKDQHMLDIFSLAQKGDKFLIRLNGEGPCARTLGLYDMLDDICQRTGMDKKKIMIGTCNLAEHNEEYHVRKNAPSKDLNELQALMSQGKIPVKNPQNIKKHFGNFIGHSSRFRLAIASYLYHNYRDKTTQTFHSSPTNELHREFIGLEDLWFHNYSEQEIDAAVEFLKIVPLRHDHHGNGPIPYPNLKMYAILDAYDDIFLDVVCNTYVKGTTFFLDEKIWRPIITKTPFVVHGPKHFMENLRRMGFQTFDRWWDEGYSEDPPDYQVREILLVLDRLAKMSLDQLKVMYNEMEPVLEHNRNVFLGLRDEGFIKEYIKS